MSLFARDEYAFAIRSINMHIQSVMVVVEFEGFRTA